MHSSFWQWTCGSDKYGGWTCGRKLLNSNGIILPSIFLEFWRRPDRAEYSTGSRWFATLDRSSLNHTQCRSFSNSSQSKRDESEGKWRWEWKVWWWGWWWWELWRRGKGEGWIKSREIVTIYYYRKTTFYHYTYWNHWNDVFLLQIVILLMSNRITLLEFRSRRTKGSLLAQQLITINNREETLCISLCLRTIDAYSNSSLANTYKIIAFTQHLRLKMQVYKLQFYKDWSMQQEWSSSYIIFENQASFTANEVNTIWNNSNTTMN